MIKYLIWDGIYETRNGDCNARAKAAGDNGGAARIKSIEHTPALVGQAGRMAPAQFRQALLGLHATVGAMDLRVTILAVSREFMPVRQNMEIKIDLYPIDKIKHLILRIYDAGNRCVYQEMFEGNDVIKGLPDKPPPTDVPEGIYAKCANRADGPYRATLWAGIAPSPLTADGKANTKKDRQELERTVEGELNTAVPDDVAKMDQDADNVPEALKKGCKQVRDTAKAVACDMRGERWWATGDLYDYVITKRDGKFRVDLIYDPKPMVRRLVHDQFSRGKKETGEKSEVGRNLSNVRLPKIRYAAYEVPTFGVPGKGTAYYLKEALEKWWAVEAPGKETIAKKKRMPMRVFFDWLRRPKKPRGKPLEAAAAAADLLGDAEAKVRHLFEHVVKVADDELKKGAGIAEDVLPVFQAPEFYFTHPDRPYTRSEMYTILEELKKRSAQYPKWLIVAGSIWWSSPWLEEKERDFAKKPEDIPYRHEPTTAKDVRSLLRGAAAGNDALKVLLDGSIKQVGQDWFVEFPPRIRGVRIQKMIPAARQISINKGVVRWKRTYPPAGGSGQQEPHYANIVYNTVAVLYNGRIVYTHQKQHASRIDGLKGLTDTDDRAHTVVRKHVEDRLPLSNTWETWNRWITELEETLIKTEGQGVFYLNGLLCGVEVCLDHLYEVLYKACKNLPSAKAKDGVDVHLLVAAGMAKNDAYAAMRKRGVLLRCDGGFPSDRYSSAYRRDDGGGQPELTRTEIALNNPVSNELRTLVQPQRDSIDKCKAAWANWIPPRGTVDPPPDSLEEYGKRWADWNLDPKDALAIYEGPVDING